MIFGKSQFGLSSLATADDSHLVFKALDCLLPMTVIRTVCFVPSPNLAISQPGHGVFACLLMVVEETFSAVNKSSHCTQILSSRTQSFSAPFDPHTAWWRGVPCCKVKGVEVGGVWRLVLLAKERSPTSPMSLDIAACIALAVCTGAPSMIRRLFLATSPPSQRKNCHIVAINVHAETISHHW